MELTIHALSHSYGDKKALTGFTHTFAPGITALLGPNGAGKSTLIHLICDLLPRQTGTIAFDGTDILSMGPAFRQVLGFMPQSQGMYDDMTAWEFLLYIAQLKGLRPRAAREQLRELLQVVNLWDAAHRRVGRMEPMEKHIHHLQRLQSLHLFRQLRNVPLCKKNFR